MNKVLAKISKARLGFEDHGLFTVCLTVDYGGASQGIGLFAMGNEDPVRPTKAGSEFIMRVLKACGAQWWDDIEGTTIYVLFEDGESEFSGKPIGIENLPFERGEQFLFGPWQDRSMYEYKLEAKLFKEKKLDAKKWLPGWKHEGVEE